MELKLLGVAIILAKPILVGSLVRFLNNLFNTWNIFNTYSFVIGNGLKADYENDVAFAHLCRMFCALAFVPVDSVKDYYDALVNSDRYDARLNGYCNYFVATFF